MNAPWDGIYVVFSIRQGPDLWTLPLPRKRAAYVGRLDGRGRLRDITGFDRPDAARAFARRVNERGALGVAYED